MSIIGVHVVYNDDEKWFNLSSGQLSFEAQNLELNAAASWIGFRDDNFIFILFELS
jgi:hypothetical protein